MPSPKRLAIFVVLVAIAQQLIAGSCTYFIAKLATIIDSANNHTALLNLSIIFYFVALSYFLMINAQKLKFALFQYYIDKFNTAHLGKCAIFNNKTPLKEMRIDF